MSRMLLAKQWLADLLGHHDYTNAISAVQSKMQSLPPCLDFSRFQKKEEKEEEGVLEEKRSFKLFWKPLSSSGSLCCSTKTLMFTRNSHDSAAPDCCLLFKTMSEQRALTLKLPYKSGQANELILCFC